MTTGDDPRYLERLEPVTDRLATVVQIVTRVVRPAAMAGLVASGVIALALIPWLFHGPVPAVIWCVLAAIGVGAALRLVWHTRLLRRTLGRPDHVVRSLARFDEIGREHARQLGSQLDHVVHADRGTTRRAAFKMLTDIRNLAAIKELGDAADELTAPISPPRLLWSGYAMIVVVVATFLAVPVALGSLLGLLLR